MNDKAAFWPTKKISHDANHHGRAQPRGRDTVLFVEHDVDIIERRASCGGLYAGRIIADDVPSIALKATCAAT
jgi:hypothetical protein